MTTATKERPILFSGEMVKAILDGRKTQTRRLRGLDQINERPEQFTHVTNEGDGGWKFWYGADAFAVNCPYGKPGDKLWVRETWARVNTEAGPGWTYKADSEFIQPEYDGENFGAGPSFNYEKYPGDYCMWYSDLIGGAGPDEGYRWTPSIHMPRWASRITLNVTNVRVERLQDISGDDAEAEGTELWSGCVEDCLVRDFRNLWDSINGKTHPWHSNPWLWVVEFDPIKKGDA